MKGPYDRPYDAIISKPGKLGHDLGGSKNNKTVINLTNYTKVYSFTNGNYRLEKN